MYDPAAAAAGRSKLQTFLLTQEIENSDADEALCPEGGALTE